MMLSSAGTVLCYSPVAARIPGGNRPIAIVAL
jgi:hypothetical protein